jgi:6-phosphogluconolactonase (cycloisomerase 2 family)
VSRRAVRSAVAALFASASLVAAAPATAAGTGLWVTQRDVTATSNVVAFTLGTFEDSLSAPAFAGAGTTGSFGVAITPDGSHLYVTNDNGGDSVSQYAVSPTDGTLTALAPATVAVTDYTGSEPEDLTVDPTGRWVYVADPFGGSISRLRIDPSTGALTLVQEFQSASNPDLRFPTGVAFSPDGKSLYVADYVGGDIAEFDVDPLTGVITPKTTASSISASVVGDLHAPEPRRLVTASVGGNDYLYTSDYANGLVVEYKIDAGTGELTQVGSQAAQTGPTGLVVDQATTPASLFVANQDDDDVSAFNIDSGTGALTPVGPLGIPAGAGPDGLALAPDGKELYVGDSGDSNLNLYTVASDGTLAADPTNPQISAGKGPSTPLVHALPSAAVAPPTPVGGALRQLAAPNDCLTGATFGCNTLISSDLSAAYQSVVSPDGKNVYAAAYLGDLVEFSRNTATGALAQMATPNDCVTDGAQTPLCGNTNGPGANNPRALALSPDGLNLYVVGAENAIAIFSRAPSTGALTWIGCLRNSDSRCTSVTGLDSPNGVAVSPDGTSVYVTSGQDSSIAEFTRDPSTGLLTQLGSGSDCISSDPLNPGGCGNDIGAGLANAVGVAVSPDGANLYVSAGGLGPGDVAEFSRNSSTGVLTQLSGTNDCMTSVGSGVTCGTPNAVGFNGGQEDIAISPDGHNVYLNSFGNSAVIELKRDPSSGVLSQLASPNDCITSDSTNPGGCGSLSASGLNGVQGVAVSPDGLDLYASASGPITSSGASNAIDEFQRNPITGALSEIASPFDCLTENGSGCPIYNVNGLGQPRRLTVSPDGANVYAVGQADGGTLVEFARTAPSGDLSIGESGAPSAALTGNTVTYSYTVSDLGPSAVDNPLVTVPLASEESLISALGSQGSCSGNPTVVCALGPLLSGTSATVTVKVNLVSIGTASVDAGVAEAGDVTDPNTANNSVITTTVIHSGAPVNMALPVITGTAQENQTLQASTGSWTNSPLGYTYQWERCNSSGGGCGNIAGATASAYVVATADVGDTLRVIVTASNLGGHNAATSAATAAVLPAAPANQGLPAISGTAQQGLPLSVSTGSWTNSPSSFTYQWMQCDRFGGGCAPLVGATASGYVASAADVGHTLSVIVTAYNAGGSTSVTSPPSALVAPGAPANASPPAISGSAQQGQALSVSTGSWANAPTSFTYQWEQCDASGGGCSSIAGAVSSSYVAAGSDVGHTLRAVVTAANGGGSTPATSAPTASVLIAAPVNTAAPAITGTAVQAQLLSSSSGSWQNSPTAFVYQWLQCDAAGSGCTPIAGASASSYVPVAADAGHTLRVTVTASNAGGSSSATSAQTAAVVGLQVNTALAPPVLAASADLTPVSGTVLVKLPGSSSFTLLKNAINIPLGSTINVTSGVVSLTVALPGGGTQTGQFYGGEFILTQGRGGRTIATLTGGSYAGCPTPPKKGAALIAGARKKPTTAIRQLWGNAHGNYTTKGRYGSAAVSGTIWLTQDRCDGTFVRVTKDNVIVVAYAHPHKKHNIRQGHHILIRAPGF